jgi:hypothetical protein
VGVPESHRDELLRVFGIGAEDLAANRAGRLGARQVERLRRSVWWNVGGVAVIVAGLVAVLAFVASRPLVWFQYAIVGALALAVVAAGYVWIRGTLRAVRAGIVECLAGPVHITLRGRTGMWLSVEGRSFQLPVRFWHVGNDLRYRVYVAPAAKRIVAMEPDGWG